VSLHHFSDVMKSLCMQPSSTGACLSDLLSLDAHWVNTDVCVVYSTRHLPVEYLLHYMDPDFGNLDDWYIITLKGKNCSPFVVRYQT